MKELIKKNEFLIGVGVVLLTIGFILLKVIAPSVVCKPDLRSIIVVLMFGFSVIHGIKLYGYKAISFFVIVVFIISWSYETLSIHTGFPFGNYKYDDLLLGKKIGDVPWTIMLPYYSMGYFSWCLALILFDKRNASISRKELILIPIMASFIMVFWDICCDPVASTITKSWVWADGGVYFGVPFSNFTGWSLCVFTFYLIFAIYLNRTKEKERMNTSKEYWLLSVMMYLCYVPQFLYLGFWGKEGKFIVVGRTYYADDIYGTTALMTIYTMLFVGFYAILKIYRSQDLNCNPKE